MFPINPPPTDPDAYSVTVAERLEAMDRVFWPNATRADPRYEAERLAKVGKFTLNVDGNWERVARSRPVIVNSIAPAVPLGPVNKTLLGMVVTSALISILALAGWGGLIFWAFSR